MVSLLLRGWKQQLTYSELSLTAAYCDGLIQPDVHDPLPDVKIVPVFKCDGFLLKLNDVSDYKLNTLVGKTIYFLLVKLLNQSKLKDRVDTAWRARLALTEA